MKMYTQAELDAQVLESGLREENLAMIIRRLCRKHPIENLVAKAKDYLKRIGLDGQLLREQNANGDPITLAAKQESSKELRIQLYAAIYNSHGGGSISSKWTVESILDAIMPIFALHNQTKDLAVERLNKELTKSRESVLNEVLLENKYLYAIWSPESEAVQRIVNNLLREVPAAPEASVREILNSQFGKEKVDYAINEAANPSIASEMEVACPICRGSRTVQACGSNPDGSEQVSDIPCPRCTDWSESVCPRCEGRLFIQDLGGVWRICPDCAGKRTPEVCPRCDGTRMVRVDDATKNVNLPCPSCHGTGKRTPEEKR